MARQFTIGKYKANFHAVYIDDIVTGIELAMTHKNANNEVFCLGGKNHVSLKQYISRESNEQAWLPAANQLAGRHEMHCAVVS